MVRLWSGSHVCRCSVFVVIHISTADLPAPPSSLQTATSTNHSAIRRTHCVCSHGCIIVGIAVDVNRPTVHNAEHIPPGHCPRIYSLPGHPRFSITYKTWRSGSVIASTAGECSIVFQKIREKCSSDCFGGSMFGEKLSISRTYSVDNNALILYCDNLHKRMYIESNRITQQNSYPVSCCDFLLVRLNVCVLQYFLSILRSWLVRQFCVRWYQRSFRLGSYGLELAAGRSARQRRLGEGPRAIRRHAVHFMQHCLLDTVVYIVYSVSWIYSIQSLLAFRLT